MIRLEEPDLMKPDYADYRLFRRSSSGSAGIIIPKKYLDALGLYCGDTCCYHITNIPNVLVVEFDTYTTTFLDEAWELMYGGKKITKDTLFADDLYLYNKVGPKKFKEMKIIELMNSHKAMYR